MFTVILFTFLTYEVAVSSALIPFIDNVTLIPISSSNSTVVNNQTCNQCLCTAQLSYAALNCFPNNTCQFFNTVPRTYSFQATTQGRVYFPQQILPNVSRCCMPDLDLLLSKLRNATPISVNVTPRCIALDNHGYLVTSELNTPTNIYRYDPTNLTLIDTTLISAPSSLLNMVYYNQAYYIGVGKRTVLMIDSNNLTTVSNITSSHINQPRDVTLLNNGQIMVVTSTNTNKLVFFNRSNTAPVIYTYFSEQTVDFSNPHGMLPVNDTFFYVTSYGNNTVSSFEANSSNSLSWTETLLINARPIAPTSAGDHVTIDECDRRWFSLESAGILIFDNNGSFIGNFSFLNAHFFDMLITDNYVMYFSDIQSYRVIRIDPNIECDS
jgi:hypothetical protein